MSQAWLALVRFAAGPPEDCLLLAPAGHGASLPADAGGHVRPATVRDHEPLHALHAQKPLGVERDRQTMSLLLTTPGMSTWVVGVPKVTVNFSETDRNEPILFLRLAAWKPGSGNYRVLSQQVTPVKGNDEQTIELNAVRHKLKKGEVVGLLVNGWSSQFRLSGSGLGTDASISGSIDLPVVKATR